jgi:hypothetical protein
MLTIERVRVQAALDDPVDALERASSEAAAGDRSWQRWIEEYDSGAAVIVRLDVVVETDGDQQRTLRLSNRGVFLEAHADPPRVESQIAEVVAKDYGPLAAELSRLGRGITPDELADMFVHIELADDLRAALQQPAPAADMASRADAGLSRAEPPEGALVD